MSAPALARSRPWARTAGFARFVFRRFFEDRCPQTAAALAYTTLLSLVPLITVALVVLSAFPVFGELMTALKIFLLTHMVPEIAGKIITVYMVQFSEKAARLTLVGTAFLVLSAILLLHTIDQAFNGIWRVDRQRPWVQRLLVYWAVLTVGPLLLGGSLSITSYLASLSLGYARHVPLLGTALLRPMPMLLTALAFALLYRLVPRRPVPMPHALIGGLVAGLVFEGVKKGFAWYVTSLASFRMVYGAFAALPIFLLWIYLSWLTVLLGAVITAALEHWRDDVWNRPRHTGWAFVAAMALLGQLVQAQRRGEPPDLSTLRQRLALSVEELEALLTRLRRAGLVVGTDGGRWLLARAADRIQAAEVHRLFLRDREAGAVPADPALAAFLEALDRAEDTVLRSSLAEIFPPAGEALS